MNHLQSADCREIVAEDDVIEQVVLKLNRVCRAATLEFALSVGRTIIDNCYGGDLVTWRRRGTKATSFRRLARHPDLPMSPASLYRCVAIYEVCQRIGIEECKHLSTSHIRLVLPLAWPEQVSLLRGAEDERWTVRQLSDRIASRGVRSVGRTTLRKGPSRLISTLRTLEKCIGSHGHLLDEVRDPMAMSPEDARRLVELSNRVQQACAALESKMSSYLAASETGSPVPLGGSVGNDTACPLGDENSRYV